MRQHANTTPAKIRKRHNADLVRRMRAGEPLTVFDEMASSFPPRPLVRKDQPVPRQLCNTKKGKRPQDDREA